ncbi:MAG: hypothetical protein AAB921_00520 [Patescibacteria group bacterium]|mgnify:FL=1
MRKVIFPRHERMVRKLCKETQVPYPLTVESVSVSFIRFTDDKADATVRLGEESLALLFFFQKKVAEDKRYNPSKASYITYTPELRAELLAFMGELAKHALDVRKLRFPLLAELGTRAEIFWQDKPPEVREL